MRVRRPFRFVFATAFGLLGCNALLDVKDIYLDPNAGPGGEGGVAEGSVGPEASVGEGGSDGGACKADLTTDPKNCGRCGHDCVGGRCTASKCEPVILAPGLGNPSGIALDANNVYFTTYGSEAVLSIAKTGGTVTTLATNVTKARGVALDGTTLYWGNGDFAFDDAGSKGGIYKCVLPGCTASTKVVAPADWGAFPTVHGAFVYFVEQNGFTVKRVPLAGGSVLQLAAPTSPFALGVDDSFVYYTSAENTLNRVLIDGGSNGTEESVGPLSPGSVGFVAVDDQRVYWTSSEKDGSGHVVSVAKASPAAGSLEYGTSTDNINAVGVALDADNVYWTTDGTGSNGTPAGDGKVFTCKKVGCGGMAPITLATGNFFGGPIAVDDQAVYWVEFGAQTPPNGRLRKVAKP